MFARRIKFIWGASRVIQGRWYAGLFGFYNRVEGEHEGGLAVSVRGVVLWSLSAMCAVYVAATGLRAFPASRWMQEQASRIDGQLAARAVVVPAPN